MRSSLSSRAAPGESSSSERILLIAPARGKSYSGGMAGRLTVLPDERFISLRPALLNRLREAAHNATGEAFENFFDRAMRALLVEGIERVGADEGTVWLLDEEKSALIPRFNSGPNAKQFVGSFLQPLSSGMISMVVAMEQPICENDVYQNQLQDRTLDQQLTLQTCAMLAVPFYFASDLRGVISCVQLKPTEATEADPPGFSADHLHQLQLTAGVLSRLIEHRLLIMCLGLETLG